MPTRRCTPCSHWWPTAFTRCISRRSCATPRTTPWKRAHERAAAQGYRRLRGDRGGSRGRSALDAARSAASRRAPVAGGEGGPPAARRREGRQAPHRGVEGEGRGPGGGGRGAHLRRTYSDARGQGVSGERGGADPGEPSHGREGVRIQGARSARRVGGDRQPAL